MDACELPAVERPLKRRGLRDRVEIVVGGGKGGGGEERVKSCTMSESSRFGSADIASTVEQLIRGEMVSSRVLCTSVERGRTRRTTATKTTKANREALVFGRGRAFGCCRN